MATKESFVRCINIEDTARYKPYAIDRGCIPDYLPLESDALDPSFTSQNANDTVGIFGRQAQACRLLDQAIYFHQRGATAAPGSLDDEKSQLDLGIRSLLGTLIDQNGGRICDFCEASAIVIRQVFNTARSLTQYCKPLIREDSALFLLHSKDAQAASLDYNSSGPLVASAASSLALKTAARIVVDVARNFNDSLAKVNMIARPPTYCHVIYRATIELISLHNSMDRIQWSQDLEILREASWNYSRRWQVAGMPAPSSIRYLVSVSSRLAAHYLKSVDKAATGLLPEPLYTFSSFQPLPNDPCLITLLDK